MGAIQGYNTNIYIASGPLSFTDEAMIDSGDHATFNISNTAKQCWSNLVTTTIQARFDDVQTLTVTGSPTGGNVTFNWNGHTTTTVAYNASASVVQSAFEGLTGVGVGQVAVSGPNGGPWVVDWKGSLAYASQPVITRGTNSLTGGTSPDVTIAHTQTGQTWSTATPTVNYPIGQVVFASALLGTSPQVRAHAGSYLPLTFLAYAKVAAPSLKAGVADVTSFQNPPSQWKQFIGLLIEGTIKISLFWIDGTFLGHMSNGDLLVIQILPGQNANQRFQGYGVLNTDMISSDVAKVNEEELDFQINGQLFYIAA